MLTSPVGLVTDLDGTVVFDGVADPQLPSFLRCVSQRGDVSVIVATSRAPRGVVEVLGDAVACLDGTACLNGALVRLGEAETRHPMRSEQVRAVVDVAFRAGVPLYVDQGHSFTALVAPGCERGQGTGLEHMRSYPDGRWCTDPARVPTDDVLKVTVVGRGPSEPGSTAPGGWEGGAPAGTSVLEDLLGLRLDSVSAYPHEDGVVDVCAAGVDKSACLGPSAVSARVTTWVAAGNDANDVAMIRAADIGVVVGDGLEGVSARRRTIRVPSRPGAVVSALERLLGL